MTLYQELLAADAETAFDPKPDETNHWTYSFACLFSFTIITTIGYGTPTTTTTTTTTHTHISTTTTTTPLGANRREQTSYIHVHVRT